MARARTGQAISLVRRTPEELDRLQTLEKEAESAGDMDVWRRARGVLSYIEGKRVAEIAENLGVVRGSVNQWLRWFELGGTEGLRGTKAPGPAPKLTAAQQEEVGRLIDAGPQACGYQSGVWTGPMIGELIRARFGVNYHNHHIPRLLHQLGFSVQRPSKRLARADLEAQAYWIRETWPEIKKKASEVRGVVMFEDEASFWLDGTLHQTWSRVGSPPQVDTYGQRKTAHLFGAVSVEDASFHYHFAPVFNGHTFHEFLVMLVALHAPRKIFLIIDNGPCHWLDEAGKKWLADNGDKIELHRLPPYSPQFNPVEGIWKATRKRTTHNRFYATTLERDDALRGTFAAFQQKPELIAAHVARYR